MKKNIAIYEGEGATYIIKNGLNHRKEKSRKKLQNNKDCIKVIKHNTGYENWKTDLDKTLDQIEGISLANGKTSSP